MYAVSLLFIRADSRAHIPPLVFLVFLHFRWRRLIPPALQPSQYHRQRKRKQLRCNNKHGDTKRGYIHGISIDRRCWSVLSTRMRAEALWLLAADTLTCSLRCPQDYFKFSDFYDRTCNNEIAIMQTMSSESLKLMEGIEYEVDPLSTEEYFLIRKSYRVDPNTSHLLALYFVIGVDNTTGDPQMLPRGTVVPMPDLHSVLKTNLTTSFLFLKSAFDDLNAHVEFHPAVHGYQWQFGPAAAAAASAKESAAGSGEKKEDAGAVAAAAIAAAAAAGASITVAPTTQQRHMFSNLIDTAILNISQPILPSAQQQQQQQQR